MESLHGEGKKEGIWVLYKGKRCELSAFSEEQFKEMKESAINPAKLMLRIVEENGHVLSVWFDQLELA